MPQLVQSDAFIDWLNLSSADRRPLVMGILNVTPDSFSDGGQFDSPANAIEHAIAMAQDGAVIIDVGGESTRPGSVGVDAVEQQRRVIPVIAGIRHKLPELTLSIDTTSAAVAAAAIDAGVSIINDVSAGRDDAAMLPLAAARHCPIILMHRQGQPLTMQDDPRYGNVLTDVTHFLLERRDAAVNAGIDPKRILLDPGIGFGKTTDHDVLLLREIGGFCSLGHAVVVGVSRKKVIGRLTGRSVPADRVFGTAAAVAWCVANGVDIVRVHDVAAMVDTVAVAAKFRSNLMQR